MGGAAGSCHRDPYLPDHYEPPCEQPPATASCADGWCTIEPGCFIMGAPWCEWYRARDTNDPVQVTLTRRFRIQQLELTQAQWIAEGLPNPSGLMPNGTGDCLEPACPVGNVNLFEALAFANLLSNRAGLDQCYELEGCTGELGQGLVCDQVRSRPGSVYDCTGYRVPTGAEWEYAARAGHKTSVYTGDIVERAHPFVCVDDPVLSPIAWYCANAGSFTHPGGQKQPNEWGLYDMIGNVAEWAASTYGPNGSGPYVEWGAELALTGATNAGAPGVQLRGGFWNTWPSGLSAAKKLDVGASPASPGVGFRLVQTLP